MNSSEFQKNLEFQLLKLSIIEGIGAVKLHKLFKALEKGIQIFELSELELQMHFPFLNQTQIQEIISNNQEEKALKELEIAHKNKIEILTPFDSKYPARIRQVPDHPMILYSKGETYPKAKKVLSIVGTRKSTQYGERFLEQLFESLASIQDLVIVSGLALGIDKVAHKLSIKYKIPTIAMMGLYLNQVYPAQNEKLAQEILKHQGGWLTETSSTAKVNQGVFPRRNRLIASICDAILVVETDIKGGSMITAEMATEYQRIVYALPGRYNEKSSRGCNYLIQKNLAKLVQTPQDLIEDMKWSGQTNKNLNKTIEIEFEGTLEQKQIIEFIRQNPKIEVEELLHLTKIPHSQLVSNLLELELRNLIESLPGNKYDVA